MSVHPGGVFLLPALLMLFFFRLIYRNTPSPPSTAIATSATPTPIPAFAPPDNPPAGGFVFDAVALVELVPVLVVLSVELGDSPIVVCDRCVALRTKLGLLAPPGFFDGRRSNQHGVTSL